MFSFPRKIQLSDNRTEPLRVCSAPATLPQNGKKTSWVTITRVGSFTDPRYGRFEITAPMLLSMVKNFEAGVVGQDIFLDVNHVPGDGSAAKILKLSVEGNRLRGLVEWTDFGLKAVKERGFTYLSAEYHDNWQDNEAGQFHGATLLGAGLTVRPVIKRLDPVTLSCESDGQTFVLSELADDLITKAKQKMDKLQQFLKKLAEAGYSQTVIDSIKELGEASINENTDDATASAVITKLEATAKKLAQGEEAAKKLADATPAAGAPAEGKPAEGKKSLSEPDNTKTLSIDDVNDAVAKALSAREEEAKKLAQSRADNEKLLAEEIGKAEGLDDDLKKELAESAKALLPDNATAEQVKALAENQIKMGNQIAAAKQLSALGYTVGGTPHITVPDEGVKKLSGIYTENLRRTNIALALAEETSPFVKTVLSQFDRMFARELDAEAKMLAGSPQTNIGNTNLPYGVQREVIKEALHDLNILNLVQTLTDFTATATTQVPYEVREMGAVMNDGLVFEGQPIPFAGVRQEMDTAFVNQMKLALTVTNEVVHFTRTAAINWDALGRNIQSNARILRELVARRLMNEIQRSSDAFAAVNVADETVTANATSGVFKTEHFPVVRPYQALDLQGKPVGLAQNPITVKVGSNTVNAFDGSGRQSAGIYWRPVSFNQGVFQLVDEKGQPKAGQNGVKISYSRATNVVKFDMDLASGVKLGEHMNGLLRLVGSRKAMMDGQRYYRPDYLLMSPVLNDQITNASEFISDQKRNGTDTTGSGDLGKIKNIAAYGTNAPNTDLGDDRIIIGQRGLTTYTVVKPFSTGDLFELTDGSGHPLGKKAAYGEEYNAIYTPAPLRGACTSIVVFSSKDRAAIGA